MHKTKGIDCKTIIFPRNQYNAQHLQIIKELGIKYYRGNGSYWVYKPRKYEDENLWVRLIRLIDAYINISGHNTYLVESPDSDLPVNVPASRFLRPYSKSLSWIDGLKFRRIKNSMTHAARNNLGYHLWWHPHNFGKDIEQNIAFLEKILKHYDFLHKKYGFTSRCMSEY